MRMKVAAGLLIAVSLAIAGGTREEEKKVALQELQDFIGGWKGNGTSASSRTLIWNESIEWSWRFKGDDTWLSFTFPVAKNFKQGEVRYLPKEELFQLTLVDKDGKNLDFKGTVADNRLTVERQDPETKEAQRIKMFLAGGGIRFLYTVETKPGNRTLYNPQYQVAFTKLGETFGASDKKPECVVTGGLGTMTVSYNGQTYYVCCTGCRDAFNENPEKVLKQYAERKKKKR